MPPTTMHHSANASSASVPRSTRGRAPARRHAPSALPCPRVCCRFAPSDAGRFSSSTTNVPCSTMPKESVVQQTGRRASASARMPQRAPMKRANRHRRTRRPVPPTCLPPRRTNPSRPKQPRRGAAVAPLWPMKKRRRLAESQRPSDAQTKRPRTAPTSSNETASAMPSGLRRQCCRCRRRPQRRPAGADRRREKLLLQRRGMFSSVSTRTSASDRLSPPPRARWRALETSISLASRAGSVCTMAPISRGVK